MIPILATTILNYIIDYWTFLFLLAVGLAALVWIRVSINISRQEQAKIKAHREKIVRQYRPPPAASLLIVSQVTLHDDLRTMTKTESATGMIEVTHDYVAFYSQDRTAHFTIANHQIREYGIVRRKTWPHWSELPTVILCGEAEDGWHAYRLTLSHRHKWRYLAKALTTISHLPPLHIQLIEPVIAMGYQQDILGHWEQTEITKLFLLSNRLLLNWQTCIKLDQLHEVMVQTEATDSGARLSIRYYHSDQELITIGFDMPVSTAREWASALSKRSGAPLAVTDANKKKTKD